MCDVLMNSEKQGVEPDGCPDCAGIPHHFGIRYPQLVHGGGPHGATWDHVGPHVLYRCSLEIQLIWCCLKGGAIAICCYPDQYDWRRAWVGDMNAFVRPAYENTLPPEEIVETISFTRCERISVCLTNRTHPLIALRQGTPSWPGAGAGVPRGAHSHIPVFLYMYIYLYLCIYRYIYV